MRVVDFFNCERSDMRDEMLCLRDSPCSKDWKKKQLENNFSSRA